MATENDNFCSSEDFYKNLDKSLSDNLSKLNELMDKVLNMRTVIAMRLIELNSALYDPIYMQELSTLSENQEENYDLKRYMDMIEMMGDLPHNEPMYKPVQISEKDPGENLGENLGENPGK